MYTNIWNDCHASICSLIFLNDQGQRIGSGTGFKANDHLITNNHVYLAPGSANVELRFVQADGVTIRATKTISYANFHARLRFAAPEANWDYAILELNDAEFATIPSLTLGDSSSISIGHEIAILGFQFDQNNLSIKKGILSSKYTRAGVNYMQIDASVNQGNSGGPLINSQNNEVVGIVTRKHTGLTDAFDNLINSFNTNIAALQAAQQGVVINFGGVNPMQALVAGQSQMRITAEQIKRSANVGIGYAYELSEINNCFNE